MKASATQVSASCRNSPRCATGRTSALEYVGNGGADRAVARRLADQPLDDGAGGVLGDAAHVAHGRLFGRGDALLSVRELGVELVFQALASRIGLGRLPLTHLAGDCLGAGAGVGQRLLVGGDGGIGVLLQAAGLGDVVVDALLPSLNGGA